MHNYATINPFLGSARVLCCNNNLRHTVRRMACAIQHPSNVLHLFNLLKKKKKKSDLLTISPVLCASKKAMSWLTMFSNSCFLIRAATRSPTEDNSEMYTNVNRPCKHQRWNNSLRSDLPFPLSLSAFWDEIHSKQIGGHDQRSQLNSVEIFHTTRGKLNCVESREKVKRSRSHRLAVSDVRRNVFGILFNSHLYAIHGDEVRGRLSDFIHKVPGGLRSKSRHDIHNSSQWNWDLDVHNCHCKCALK